MTEYTLKYGCNPDQKPARLTMPDGGALPFTVLNGRPGYINFLDALNAWQLVRELREAAGLPAAASFKHVSPAGAALGLPLSEPLRRACFVEASDELSPLACAYARARGADRLCSYGDFAALSDVCDVPTANLLRREVSDGVIAPGYEPEALEILKQKRKGGYTVIQMDPDYRPAESERREVFGVVFEQARHPTPVGPALLEHIVTREKSLPASAARDLLVALITLKYTQSNSVCYAVDGQAVGVGAGQQSRIHCTRLAGDKADAWFWRQSERVLSLPFRETLGRAERDNAVDAYIHGYAEADILADGVWQRLFTSRPAPFSEEARRAALGKEVALGSDAFFPFGDNIERAYLSGVRYIAQPGGSIRDDEVIARCDAHGMVMAFTGLRLFHH